MHRFTAVFCAVLSSCVAADEPQWVQALNGAAALAAALPKHGPRPSAQLDAKMQDAGKKIFSAFELLQTAQQDVSEADETFRAGAGDNQGAAAQNLATAEELVERAHGLLAEGTKASNEISGEFMNNANPMGPPPEEPKDWNNIEVTGRHSHSKERTVRRAITAAKARAEHLGVSLISVASEKAVTLGSNEYGKGEDDKLLNFLAQE